MSKYIKLDDLQEFCDHQIAHEITPNDFQRMNHLEIVRCKDCNNGVIYCDNGDIICDHVDSNGNDTHPDDWFCADGEPKARFNTLKTRCTFYQEKV